MNNKNKTNNKKRMLWGVALLLVTQVTLCNLQRDSLEIQSQDNLHLEVCSSAAEANLIASRMRAANPSRYAPYQINVIFFKPEGLGESPTCFQNGYDSPFQRTLFLDAKVKTGSLRLSETTEQNTEPSVVDSHQRIGTSPSITPAQLSADARKAGIHQGVALILLTPESGLRYYYFQSFGGWRGACHPDCSSCTGTRSDLCLICSDPQSVVKTTLGSYVGPCLSCSRNKNSDKPECHGKVEVIEILTETASTPRTIDSLNLEDLRVAKAQVRASNKGMHIIRLKLPEDIIKAINQLGNNFFFTDFMRVTINGLTSPADYTFTGVVNDQDQRYDLEFSFTRDHPSLEVKFEVTQPNYFLLNLEKRTSQRRGSRRLQTFPTQNQQALDSAKLVQRGKLRANLSTMRFNEKTLMGLEDAGIYIRIFL